MIGSKGLGFRSILNWSHQPIIFSGSLRLVYSPDYAQKCISEWASQYQKITDELDDEKKANNGILPAPLLPFPTLLPDDDHPVVVNDINSEVINCCQLLRDKGYTTVIGMPFDRPDDSMKAALAQLKELRPEFLLFSEALSEVTICGEGLEYSTWTCSRLPEEDDRVILKDSTSTTQWKLFRKEGQIPEEFCRDRTVADKYNIIVALREEGVSEPANLYSFFPTSVPLPLPVLCHATLELEQNRKHFQEIESNRFVLKELAEHLLDIAKEFLSIEENLWCGIDIINPQEQGKFPTELNILDKHLVEAAKSRKLIPTLSGRIVKPDNAVLFQYVNTDWLPRRAFGDVAKARNPSDHQFFQRLGVPFLTAESFKQRIEELNDLTVNERVGLL